MLRTFLRSRMGLIGTIMLTFVVLVAIFAPLIAPYNPYTPIQVQADDILQPPSAAHLLGTDDAGKDVLSQLIYGARVSLIVGFAASLMTMLIGTAVGLIAGYFGGVIDNLLMRIVDFLLVIPDLPLALVIIAVWGRGLAKIIFVIAILGWTTMARLVRAQTLTIKERQYILRAKAIGADSQRIILRHILPQVLPIIIAQSVLDISAAILEESSLSFLGLGDPTLVSWGNMLNFAFQRAISAQAWWFLLPPGFAILWVTLALILMGTALEEVVNPRIKAHHLFDPRWMIALIIPVPPKLISAPVEEEA
ncbi:MAG TPA: ABC transporter permease [Phototrophicaceae bacterium]|nr:ABC transporter permease [Phototrophicaceae bacterium]